MAHSNKSPFAELSFSEQQEQWRAFRAQHLEYQPVQPAPVPQPEPAAKPATKPAPQPVRMPAYMQQYAVPQHHNLDRVRAQLAAASRRAGVYQPVNAKE